MIKCTNSVGEMRVRMCKNEGEVRGKLGDEEDIQYLWEKKHAMGRDRNAMNSTRSEGNRVKECDNEGQRESGCVSLMPEELRSLEDLA